MNDIETLAPESLRAEDPVQRSTRSQRIHRQTHGVEPTVHKQARGGERASLRREAEVLRAVGGTDLVRLVDLIDGPETTELVLRDTGGPSLAAALADPDTTATAALSLLAATCDTVSRLHQRGWGHGRIEADHVLLSARGRIRLCSLGAAAPIDVDPTVTRADRTAVLRMVDDWCRQPAGSGMVPPWSTRVRAWALERRTHRLVDDPDPQVLARILRRTARAGSVTEAGPTRRIAVAVAIAMAAVSLVGVAMASGVVLRSVSDHDAVASPAAPQASKVASPSVKPTTSSPANSTPTTSAPSATSTTAVAPPSTPVALPAALPAADPSCATPDALHPDVDGDGCGDAVSTDANAVLVGDRRYRLGTDGDVVAVGDWDCDGTATPALLRPSNGKVFTFDRWATESDPSTATQIGAVDGAIGFASNDGRCGAPRVVSSGGIAQPVDVTGARP